MFFNIFFKTGSFFSNFLENLGKICSLFGRAMFVLCIPPYRWKNFIQHLEFIGNKSLSIVLFTALFTGMVLALQMYEALKKFQSESLVGGIVALALSKELAPVLTALMVNSRAGSAIAAEIGSMRVTEQIDAIEAMAVNSVQYLISPRIFAGIIMLPILTIIADIVGVLGGYLIAVPLLGLDHGLYINKIIDLVSTFDILGGLLKSAVFGAIVTFIGSYFGYTASGGAKGVGIATTRAVVTSAVMVLAFDYVITSFLVRI
jgi:phospholipid/cholesterol/gamma-HCH transport system permease protein